MLRRLGSMVAVGVLVLMVAPHAVALPTTPVRPSVWLLDDRDGHDGFGFGSIAAVTGTSRSTGTDGVATDDPAAADDPATTGDPACADGDAAGARKVLVATRRLRQTQLRLVDARLALMDARRRMAQARATTGSEDDQRVSRRIRVVRGRITRLKPAVAKAEAALDDARSLACTVADGGAAGALGGPGNAGAPGASAAPAAPGAPDDEATSGAPAVRPARDDHPAVTVAPRGAGSLAAARSAPDAAPARRVPLAG